MNRTTALILAAAVLIGTAPAARAASNLPFHGIQTLSAAPQNLRAVADPRVCATQSAVAVSDCQAKLKAGLLLFIWDCNGCRKDVTAYFVVANSQRPASDINLVSGANAAFSARAGEFRASDCVAIRLIPAGGQGASVTSAPVCLAAVFVAANSDAVNANAHAGGAGPLPIVLHVPQNAVKPPLQPRLLIPAASAQGPPFGLIATVDINACAAKLNTMFCKSAIEAGQMAFYWTWSGPAVDGFKLYRVDGGRHALAQNDQGQTPVTFIAAPAGGFDGKCYAVSAYASSFGETSDSSSVCLNSSSALQTSDFQPAHIRWIGHAHDHSIPGTGSYPQGQTPSAGTTDYFGDWVFNGEPNTPKVGYRYTGSPNLWESIYYRTGVYFDLSSLKNRTIVSAYLKLTVNETKTDGPGSDHQTSCLAVIGVGQDYWWNYGDWIAGGAVLSPGVVNGPDVSYNVTSIVNSWENYAQPNFGFVLMGSIENDGFLDNAPACATRYENTIHLVVNWH